MCYRYILLYRIVKKQFCTANAATVGIYFDYAYALGNIIVISNKCGKTGAIIILQIYLGVYHIFEGFARNSTGDAFFNDGAHKLARNAIY